MSSSSKRVKLEPAWPALAMTGPGGFDGEEKLRALCDDPKELTALFVASMGLNAKWLLDALGLPAETDIPMVIACHHRDRCWSGQVSDRRATGAVVAGHRGLTLIFPPFADAPGKADSYTVRAAAPRGLLGCVHAKLLVFFRKDRLRVVVSTANFTRGGWKHQRNHLWSMDFPALPDSVPLEALLSCNSSFGEELAAYMSNLLAPCAPSESDARLVTMLRRYDFSAASREGIHLVASIPGIVPLRLPTRPPGACATFRCGLAGSDHHRPVAEVILDLHGLLHANGVIDEDGCCALELVPMPHNTFDANAIAVRLPFEVRDQLPALMHKAGGLLSEGKRLASKCADGIVGFLPKAVAEWIGPLIRCLGLSFRCRAPPRQLFSSHTRVGVETLLIDVYLPTASRSGVSDSTAIAPANADDFARLDVCMVQLLARIERPRGLARLRQLLRPHSWPPADKAKAFHYTTSSCGNLFSTEGRRFLATFSRAVGSAAESTDSADEDGGHWTSVNDSKSAAITESMYPAVVYPSIGEIRSVCEAAQKRAAFIDATTGSVITGGRVRLNGLEQKPDLNGRCGTIVEPSPGENKAKEGRVLVRLDRELPQGKKPISVSLTKLVQGPPSISWPYMCSDKTWKVYQDLQASQKNEDKCLKGKLRVCELKRMRMGRNSGAPKEDKQDGIASLMHSKIAIRWWDDGCGWIYIGSHNFSPAAWGMPLRCESAEANARDRGQQLWTANYELGVLRIEPPKPKSHPNVQVVAGDGNEANGSAAAHFWRELRHQLGYKPGSRFCEGDGWQSNHDLALATQRRIGRLARELHGESPPPAAVGSPGGGGEAMVPYLYPGEPLREVVVGVATSCEWLPGQGLDPSRPESGDVELGGTEALLMLQFHAQYAQAREEDNGEYARALVVARAV